MDVLQGKEDLPGAGGKGELASTSAARTAAAARPGLTQVRDVVCPECRFYLGPMAAPPDRCPECGSALAGSHHHWKSLDRGLEQCSGMFHALLQWLRRTRLDLPLWAAVAASVAAFVMVTVQELTQRSLAAMVLNPFIEEALKVAFLVAVVETRPTRLGRTRDVAVVAMSAALFYSITRNITQAMMFHPDLTAELALPWLLSVLLHMGCTAVATLGVIWAWRSMREGQFGRWALAAAVPSLILAAILHGVGMSLPAMEIFG